MNSDYFKNLLVPTPAQTERFIQLVSRDHGWYKHLDREIPTEFIFFLDPNARRPFKLDKDDNVVFQPVSDDERTALNASYGTWRYYNANYTAKFFADSDGFYHDLNPFIGLSIINQSGDVIELPQELVEKGRIGLTAYLHGGFGEDNFTKEQHNKVIETLKQHLLSLRDFYSTMSNIE